MTLLVWAALVGTTFIAALLYIISGFGFAVLAVPLYLLLRDPAQAVQLAIFRPTLPLRWCPGCGEPSLQPCCCA